MINVEHAYAEAPLGPEEHLDIGGRSVGVLDLARLPDPLLERAVDDPYLLASVRLVGRAGALVWPGADRWVDASLRGQAVSALLHNAYVASRLFAMDVLANTEEPLRHVQAGERVVQVLGLAQDEWKSGDVTLSSGIPSEPPVRISEQARRAAFSQIGHDLTVLEPFDCYVSMADVEVVSTLRTADVFSAGALASRALVRAFPDDTNRMELQLPKAQSVAQNPVSRWAFCLAMAVLTRNARACEDQPVATEPPPSPAGELTPVEYEQIVTRRNRRLVGAVGAGMVAVVGAAFGVDWVSKRLGRLP